MLPDFAVFYEQEYGMEAEKARLAALADAAEAALDREVVARRDSSLD